MGQVVGVDADAVTADQAGREREEVPLGPRRGQHIAGVDAEPVEDDESSFISAMLRSRWVFSITLAASATLIDGALWMPAVTIEP